MGLRTYWTNRGLSGGMGRVSSIAAHWKWLFRIRLCPQRLPHNSGGKRRLCLVRFALLVLAGTAGIRERGRVGRGRLHSQLYADTGDLPAHAQYKYDSAV